MSVAFFLGLETNPKYVCEKVKCSKLPKQSSGNKSMSFPKVAWYRPVTIPGRRERLTQDPELPIVMAAREGVISP